MQSLQWLGEETMAQLMVRNLDDDVALRLKQRAARRGRSMEEEVRRVLRDSVRDELDAAPLGTRIAARFAGLGFTGDLPELRGSEAVPVDFRPAKPVKARTVKTKSTKAKAR
jgi:antitoxin FitA